MFIYLWSLLDKGLCILKIFIWPCWILEHARSNSLTRGGIQAPCIGSAESRPLDHQGSPQKSAFYIVIYYLLVWGLCEISYVSLGNAERFYFWCSILGSYSHIGIGQIPLKEHKETMFRFQVANKSASCLIIFYLPTSISPGFEGSALP